MSVRIIHAADLHLDSPFEGLPADSARLRRAEQRQLPERIAALAWKALSARRPRYVYTINRNPLLLLMDRLPDRWQTGIIRRVLGD